MAPFIEEVRLMARKKTAKEVKAAAQKRARARIDKRLREVGKRRPGAVQAREKAAAALRKARKTRAAKRSAERRAAAVRNYLERRYGIDSTRLRSVGLGEDRPLIADDPENGRNRRVEIVNLGE